MIEIPKRVAESVDQFTGRAWLLPKLLEWWDKRKDERIFLLTGGPGTGKSMILAWLACAGRQKHSPRKECGQPGSTHRGDRYPREPSSLLRMGESR